MEEVIKKAFNCACRVLAGRAHSSQELSAKLIAKGFEPSVVEATLAKLDELGYLDDAHFAQRWASLKAGSAHWSDRRITASLSQKGISDEEIASALSAARSETSEAETIAKIIAKKQRGEAGNSLGKKEKIKLINSLIRKGFTPDLAFESVASHFGAPERYGE